MSDKTDKERIAALEAEVTSLRAYLELWAETQASFVYALGYAINMGEQSMIIKDQLMPAIMGNLDDPKQASGVQRILALAGECQDLRNRGLLAMLKPPKFPPPA